MIYLNAASTPLSTSASPTRSFSSSTSSTLLSGTSGADALSNSSSNATLAGGAGDDTYTVWSTTMTVSEQFDFGIDTVQSYASRFVLGANIENLQMMWGNGNGVGNALNNIVIGNTGNDTLDGGSGNDVLVGGAGADDFVVVRGNGSDVIADFLSGTDQVRLQGYALYDFVAVKAAMAQVGADVVLALGNGENLVFRNAQVGGFTEADFRLPADPAHVGMRITFDDDFASFSASANGIGTTWKTSLKINEQVRVQTNNREAGYYSDSSVGVNPFSLSAGVLDIAAAPGSNPLGLAYNTGLITTAKSFAQTYGYFEARIDMPAGQGFWPAFWLLPADGTWPPEIDIVEMLGHATTTAYASLHSTTTTTSTTTIKYLPDLAAGFHTYGLSWQADMIHWYIDGAEVAEAATPADMNKPMYAVLDLAVGDAGSWPGQYDPSKPTAHMLIDYVRAWQYGSVITGPGDVATYGGIYTLKPDGVSDIYDFSRAGAGIDMDATGLSNVGVHTVTGSAYADELLGGTSNVNFSAGAGNDQFTFGAGTSRVQGGTGNDAFVFVKNSIATNNQIIDFHLDLSNGTEHDQLELRGFSTLAHLDFISAANPGAAGQWQYYRVVDGSYVSPVIGINVTNGLGHLAGPDYQFV